MKACLDESEIASRTEVLASRAVTCCGHDALEVAKRIEKGVSGAKAAVSANLEEGDIAAERLLKRSLYAVEEGIREAAHALDATRSSGLRLPLPQERVWALWCAAR